MSKIVYWFLSIWLLVGAAMLIAGLAFNFEGHKLFVMVGSIHTGFGLLSCILIAIKLGMKKGCK